TLSLFANAATPVIQSAASGTTINNGHTFISMATNNGALAGLTLNLGAIARIGTGTFVIGFDTNTIVTTTTPLTNNIIGGYPTVNFQDWATKVSNNIVAMGSAGAPAYGVNDYSSGT